MYQATSISYNGITSESLDAISCRVDNSSGEEVYVSDREIKKDTSGRSRDSRSKNYLYKVERKSRKFTIELGFLTLTDQKAREVSKVFFQDKYLPLIPQDTGRVYYCMPISSKIKYIGTGGYISFEMETFDEFSYSAPLQYIKNFPNNVSDTFIMTILGDTDTYPVIQFKVLTVASTIKLLNTTTNKYIELGTYIDDYSVSFPLILNETITVDCEKEIITTDQSGIYRYNNFLNNSEFFSFLSGVNNMTIEGSTIMTIEYKNKFLF